MPCSAYAWKKIDDGEEIISVQLGIKIDWKGQGWLITPNSIVSRRGYLNRRTWIIDRHKIQSIHIYQSPFMRIHNLAHLIVYVAGTEIVLPDVQLEDAHDSYENLNTQWKLKKQLTNTQSSIFGFIKDGSQLENINEKN